MSLVVVKVVFFFPAITGSWIKDGLAGEAWLPGGPGQGMGGAGIHAAAAAAAKAPLAVWIARLVFLVPIVAVWVIVQNFRGNVGKALQWAAAATWILVRILVPYFVSRALLASMPPFFRDMANAFGGNNSTFFSPNFGIGGWVLILSRVGMALLA